MVHMGDDTYDTLGGRRRKTVGHIFGANFEKHTFAMYDTYGR